MRVLGIGGSVHDFSCCLVEDGRVVAAVEEERISRVKYHPLGRISVDQMRLRSVDYCLDMAGLTIDDIDHVVANDLVFPAMLRGLPRVERINHHLSHAAACYLVSPHREAAILVIDGFGSFSADGAETVSYFTGSGADITLELRHHGVVRRKRQDAPFSWRNFDFVEDSLGVFYSHVTDLLGFGAYEEGKTMGLAAYGGTGFVAAFDDLVRMRDDGTIVYRRRERDAVARFVSSRLRSAGTGDRDDFRTRADIAHATQLILERAVLRHATLLHERTGADTLCASGGVFMNCAANYRLVTEGPFREVFIHGASGDNGTGIGAALYGYHRTSGLPRTPTHDPVIYTGRSYDETECRAALTRRRGEVRFHRSDDPPRDAAVLLSRGNVTGWFQGGSEFGARALGNRSILADPRKPGMKDRINAMVKGREAFRPFAPSVLAERQHEYFDLRLDSPYMCVNAHALGGGATVPAVTHVDGSARFQTVGPAVNPAYHALLREFARLTGVGVLLNTSFNEREPIVESPDQALDCFLRTDMDCLVLGPFVVTKPGSAARPG
ncbi:carbamoyltransferase [Polymorphospora lycopeni]|uniref:Carbamoyltransferase C-terminal domain-containing protein n=1 Tax=Polymorphospora lycopeni TaxID=3140240 RepID=A0ABV5CQG5_9ACTN